MTRQKSFKRLVRSRMDKTGESYTAARASLLAAEEPEATVQPVFTVSEDVIRRRTGRGWEEWLDLLDEWGAVERSHKEIAGWVSEQEGTDGWSAQAVTVSYERARGMRAVGERPDGFSVTASKTVAVPVDRAVRRVRRRVAAGAVAARRRCASAPRPSRGRLGSTGVTARPG